MKKLSLIIIVVLLIFLSSRCIKRDNMEGIIIYTTVYPVEYLANEYGLDS